MPYNKDTNYENEIKYLHGLMNKGTAGERSWANEQMGVLNQWKANQPKQQTPQPQQNKPSFGDMYNGFMNGFGFNAGNYISEQQKAIDAQVDQYLREQQSYYDKLGTQLDSRYNKQRTDLDETFNASQEDINKQTYENLERSKAMGSMRGMTSSAQQVGMDNAVTRAGMGAHTENARQRQSALSALSEQLNMAREQLAGQYDQALKNSQSMKSQMIGQVQDKAQQMMQNYNQMAFNGALQMYGKQQDYEQQDKMADREYAWKDADRNANFEQQEKMFNLNFNGDLKKMGVQQGYDLDKMAKSHGYDMDKINVQFQNQWKIMTEQERQQTARTMAQINSQRQLAEQQRQWMKEDQYSELQNRLDQQMLGVIIDTASADRANQIRQTGKGTSPSEFGNDIRSHYNAYLNGETYDPSAFKSFGADQAILNQLFSGYPQQTSDLLSNFFTSGGTSSSGKILSPIDLLNAQRNMTLGSLDMFANSFK